MKTLINEIIDEIIDENTEENDTEEKSFKIDNDDLADWAIEKIKAQQEEIERARSIVKGKIAELLLRISQIENEGKQTIDFFTNALEQYAQTVKMSETKAGNKVYKLVSGKLSLKRQQPKFEINDDVLCEWLIKQNKEDFITYTRKPQWGELKKEVQVAGNAVITETGEVVEGVTAEEREPIFKVEF